MLTENADASINLAAQLKAARISRKITQYRLADMLQVTRKTVVRWEHNQRRPAPKFLAQLRKIFPELPTKATYVCF